jgi:tripeptide aminopeptidase
MTEKTVDNGEETPVFISEHVKEVYDLLLKDEKIQEGLSFIESENDNTTKNQIEVTRIPAPTFQEEVRGKFYKKRLEELGLQNITVDKVGNVFGIRRGTGNGPRLAVCAHLDTVFPKETDITVREEDGKVFAPGIADDGRGLAVVLTLLKVFNQVGIQTKGDILFGATVGEEGLGDLNGVKALFQHRTDIDGFISIEPGNPARTTYLGTGSHRYRVTFKGPGGHSFGDFGLPSAIHAMGRAIAGISDIETPADPKTTFTIGTVSGGTSVNTIAAEATMLVDLRSTSQEELLKLEDKALAIIHQAVEDENKRWNTNALSVDLTLVGDRPAGEQSADAFIVQASAAASKAIGCEPGLEPPSSTDSNVPISLGIPAVTLGGGGTFGGAHTLQEYFDATDAYYGVQKVFLTILGLVGVDQLHAPLLEKR